MSMLIRDEYMVIVVHILKLECGCGLGNDLIIKSAKWESTSFDLSRWPRLPSTARFGPLYQCTVSATKVLSEPASSFLIPQHIGGGDGTPSLKSIIVSAVRSVLWHRMVYL